MAKNKKGLVDKKTLFAPSPGLMRMRRARLSNMNAIPDISPISSGGGEGGGPAPITPITSATEILTQAGDFLTTQAGVDLITQQ